ncbi:hypothetical protein [Paenibacillus sp. GCM10012306]|uniref:hypothetical protein n=1 Tax=Paenibacillus sp. GCM10012306 TaxID=3317342 RepID=UPI0036164C4F
MKQKDLLHSIINKITVNIGNNPDERSVKDIELFFDASINDDFVLTCDTVHRIIFKAKLKGTRLGPLGAFTWISLQRQSMGMGYAKRVNDKDSLDLWQLRFKSCYTLHMIDLEVQ